jgi:hypothetical protein
MRSALCAALLLSLLRIGHAAELMEFQAPAFLTGPSVSRSAFGVTYAYKGQAPHAASELQLTVVAVPAQIEGAPVELPAQCLAAFLDELGAHDAALQIDSTTRQVETGQFAMLERRWLSRRGALPITGVTACGMHRGYFVSANYADDLHGAVQSFPALRAALQRLVVRF